MFVVFCSFSVCRIITLNNVNYLKLCYIYPEYSDRQTGANRVYPDQIHRKQCLVRSYTVCYTSSRMFAIGRLCSVTVALPGQL